MVERQASMRFIAFMLSQGAHVLREDAQENLLMRDTAQVMERFAVRIFGWYGDPAGLEAPEYSVAYQGWLAAWEKYMITEPGSLLQALRDDLKTPAEAERSTGSEDDGEDQSEEESESGWACRIV